ILCENEQDGEAYEQQPDYPNPPDWLAGLNQAQYALAYLDVRCRHLTALHDPLLLQGALGGPDTATRPNRAGPRRALPPTRPGVAGDAAAQRRHPAARSRTRTAPAGAGDNATVQKADAEIATIDAASANLSAGPTSNSQLDESGALAAAPRRRLTARTTGPPP